MKFSESQSEKWTDSARCEEMVEEKSNMARTTQKGKKGLALITWRHLGMGQYLPVPFSVPSSRLIYTRVHKTVTNSQHKSRASGRTLKGENFILNWLPIGWEAIKSYQDSLDTVYSPTLPLPNLLTNLFLLHVHIFNFSIPLVSYVNPTYPNSSSESMKIAICRLLRC